MTKGFVIAGTQSGCGKTTITLGLLYVLKEIRLKRQEFHYSSLRDLPSTSLKTCYMLEGQNSQEGYCVNRVLASYIHVYFCSYPDIAKHFINFVKEGM